MLCLRKLFRVVAQFIHFGLEEGEHMNAVVGFVATHGIRAHFDFCHGDAEEFLQTCECFVLMEYHILKTNRQYVCRSRCIVHDFALIEPADRTIGPDVVRFFVPDAEVVQIVGQMGAENAVARVTNPVDVADIGDTRAWFPESSSLYWGHLRSERCADTPRSAF